MKKTSIMAIIAFIFGIYPLVFLFFVLFPNDSHNFLPDIPEDFLGELSYQNFNNKYVISHWLDQVMFRLFPFLFSIFALIYGLRALLEIRKKKLKGIPLAIAGIIFGGACIIFYILFAILF